MTEYNNARENHKLIYNLLFTPTYFGENPSSSGSLGVLPQHVRKKQYIVLLCMLDVHMLVYKC